ncbi:MAG: enoyl-CoA hydratase/isomerase family protein [Pseudomonadota bacterium]
MSDIDIRTAGRAGRITLTRSHALNAMTYDMCMAIDTAMRNWREDGSVDLVIIDAEGDKAFCAGGDIAELYDTGTKGDLAYGRRFWRDEYRLNALIAEYPKPVVSFLQGFTMGGGVGLGCHGSHRVVCETSQIAMPECGIGLIPDVGGSMILSHAPGHVGEYLGTTAGRMDADDAIFAGFADHFLPRDIWGDVIDLLEASGQADHVTAHAQPPALGPLRQRQDDIDRHFDSASLDGVLASLQAAHNAFSEKALKSMSRNSPLSMACTIEMIRRLRDAPADIRTALDLEYRFTFRAMEQGDFLEGIRAQIIDKDRNPKWQFQDRNVPDPVVQDMLQSLGPDTLTFEEDQR